MLPNTSPDRGPPMLSRAVLGGPGMCAWAAGPAAGAPSPAELPHDGCARRRGEPRVEQLPGNRLLSRPTLRPLSPSQGPFFFPLLLLSHWSQTLHAGEKLQPMPPAAPVTGDLGNPWPQEGKRERRFWERWREGAALWRPSLAVEDPAGTLLSLALPCPPSPLAVLKKPEPSPFS